MMNDEREQSWREHAMAEASYGEGHAALVRAIRKHRSASATYTIWPDRRRLLRFLEEETADFHGLLDGSNTAGGDEDRPYPYLGWYAGKRDGRPVEVALAPSTSDDGACVVVAADDETLRRLGARLADYAIRPEGRCLRYVRTWKSSPELDQEIGKVTWEDLVLPPAVLADVRDAVEGFFQHRAAFAALGFAWRRGILLIGPPGTGKTMVCKAAAVALPDLPFLYVRDFDEEAGRNAIKRIFERARKLAPCILAFEDIDGLVGDQNRTIFLNELDGFRNNEGLLIIASSNHPGKIDEALLKRPSRFDRVFHLGMPGLAERREFCRGVLARSTLAGQLAPSLDVDDLARQVARRTDGFTPAYLKEVFISAALQRAQEGASLLDEAFATAALAQVAELRRYLRRMRDPEALAELGTRGDTPMGFRH